MQLKLALLVAFIIFTTGSSLAFAAGEYSFVKSWGSQGLTKTGSFTYPQYAAVDDTGNVYVTDLGNTRVQKFSNDGTFLHAWGIKGTRPGEFHAPAGIAVGGNSVYVVDHELHAVKKFDTNGKFIKAWGSEGTDAGKLKLPNGIAVSKDNYVYVVDTGNSRIQKFDSEGQFVSIIGSSGTGDGQLLTPLGIAVDSDGSIYVGDYGNKRIQKFASNGSFLKSFTSSAGGLKIAPDGVTVDMSGNIILADTTNNRIVVLDKDGNTKTAFGTTGTGNIQFKMPKDVVSEADGDLFVVDSSNHRIQKFGPGQTQTTQTQTTQTQTTQTQTTQNTVQVKQTGTDLKKPIIVPPKDIYVEATGGLTVVSIGQAVANDDSGIQSLTNNAPQQFPLGITTVIWTAIDNAGNVGIATQTVTVGDSTPPVISGLSDITMEANGVQNTVELGNPKVTDQVGVMTVENDAPSTFALGETVVTWTAVDVAKNVETLSQKVTIIDTKPPKIRAPAAVTVEATSIDSNSVTLGEPSVTDNSEISSITNDAPTLFPIGETVVTWTAVDVAGNVADTTQKVIVTDTAAPSIAQPAEIIVEAVSSKENPVELSAPAVTDIQQTTITNDAPQFFPLGQTTVTWLVTDSSGNNSTATQYVSIVDTTAPTVIPPPDVTQEATGAAGNTVTLGEPTVQDVTEISSISNNAPQDYAFGTTTVTWTATDMYGNSASANQTVTIIDTTAPKITAPADVTVEATSMSENIAVLGEPKTSDLVAVVSVTNDAAGFFPLGQTTVTWTATDSSGNTSTASQIVEVVDTTAPAITVPEDLMVEATGPSENNVVIGTATATDAIGVDSITNDAPAAFNLGLTTVTWTTTDSSGNVATAAQNITVVDTTSPVITPQADITVEATSAQDNLVTLIQPDVTDSVSQVAITSDAPDKFPLGETVITWTATDEAGNSATATQKVTVVDTTAPTITAPADLTVEATSKSDNVLTLDAAIVSDNVGIASVTSDAPEKFTVGQTIITWSVVDTSGLSSTAQQVVNVVDTTKPVISISDITIEATSEDKNAVDLGNVKATDQVEVVSVSSDAPSSFPLGVTTVIWTATDAAGNSATATQMVVVEDTVAPTITAPQDLTFEATSASDNMVSITVPDATDSVSAVNISSDAPEKFPVGETVITWTAKDSSGNSATATQKVTVVDTTAPTITAPADLTVEATSAQENVVSLGTADASDSVLIATVTSDAPDKFPLGETVITWTATDEAGNSATATQKVTVVDTTAPTITAPADLTVEATSKSDNVITLEVPIASDSVGIASVSSDAPEKFPVGETIIIWTATDTVGNIQSATQKITIVDTIPPAFAKISAIVVEATSNNDNHISIDAPAVSDIQDIVSLTSDAPSTFALGQTTVTWTATDEAGNSATATQKVTVVDTTAPTITAPADLTVEATSAQENVVSLGTADASDSVLIATVTSDAPDKFPLGETVITWTATDSSGNNSTATQKITLVDTTAPVIVAPQDLTFEATSASDNMVSITVPDATDSVSAVNISSDAPSTFALGQTTVTWTATDEAGNVSTATQKITVVDTTAPNLSIPENIVIDAVSLMTPVTVGTPTATDLTDDLPKITSDAPNSFPLGQTLVTWFAEDKFGNSVTHTQTVTVEACGKPESAYNKIVGEEDDDILIGTNLADLIITLGGDDIISGEKGNDCILAGDGDDIIYGNEGNDMINGGDGADILKGQSGNDVLISSTGVDIIDGGDDNDSCIVSEQDGDITIKCES